MSEGFLLHRLRLPPPCHAHSAPGAQCTRSRKKKRDGLSSPTRRSNSPAHQQRAQAASGPAGDLREALRASEPLLGGRGGALARRGGGRECEPPPTTAASEHMHDGKNATKTPKGRRRWALACSPPPFGACHFERPRDCFVLVSYGAARQSEERRSLDAHGCAPLPMRCDGWAPAWAWVVGPLKN